MTDAGDIFNDDFLGDIVDAPKEDTEQHKKWECLKGAIDKGQRYLLGSKWTHGRVGKANDETINKTYAEYKQCELNEKYEKTGKALGKHVINLYSTGISRWFKIKDVKKLHQDIEHDPIIKNQMAGLGSRFVCTLGDYLIAVLIAVHTANNVNFDNEQDHENEDYESEGP